jgi:hypothetical protein
LPPPVTLTPCQCHDSDTDNSRSRRRRLGSAGASARVHVAAQLDRPLVTADRRLARAVQDEVAIVVCLGDEEAA